jgi:hypothetical protein
MGLGMGRWVTGWDSRGVYASLFKKCTPCLALEFEVPKEIGT